MCTTCGCGGHDAAPEGNTGYRKVDPADASSPAAWAFRANGRWYPHEHAHGAAAAAAAAHARVVEVERDLLARNDAIADANRHWLAERGICALNLMSSPGSGKTSVLARTIRAWGDRTPVCVIEGDQQTSIDADRIRACGVCAMQVNTGKGCHLDARMIGAALRELDPPPASLLFIENVGNLVCPAAFDLGEAGKVVILSVTEGDDKPLKYPDMFAVADLMLVNKVDLAPHVDFDLARAVGYAQRVRPGLEAIVLSAKTGEGFDRWLDWIARGVAAAQALRGEVAKHPAAWATAVGETGVEP
jgi:hydrogenase nickel incorporation protein HypB